MFISHDLDVVHHMCDQVIVVYLGRVVEEGPTDEVLKEPLHPYTRGLLASLPSIIPGQRPAAPLVTGELPNPVPAPQWLPLPPTLSARDRLLPRCLAGPCSPWRQESRLSPCAPLNEAPGLAPNSGLPDHLGEIKTKPKRGAP